MEAAVISIQSALKETINNRVEDTLASVGQRTQDLHEEPIEEAQLGLRAVTTSLDTRNKSIREEIADIKKDLHEEMIQRTQVEIEIAS
jgi:predicted  nucleic acid-binding Zn-ribbon protein